MRGDTSTEITFVNRTNRSVRTYWLDYEGARQFYNTIPSGGSYRQQTYVTHPWVVTDAREDCIGLFFPDDRPRVVEIR